MSLQELFLDGQGISVAHTAPKVIYTPIVIDGTLQHGDIKTGDIKTTTYAKGEGGKLGLSFLQNLQPFDLQQNSLDIQGLQVLQGHVLDLSEETDEFELENLESYTEKQVRSGKNKNTSTSTQNNKKDKKITIGKHTFKAQYVYGALEILGGIFLAFWGALLLDMTFGLLLGIACTVGLFALTFNIKVVPGLRTFEPTPTIITWAACALVGSIVACCIYRLVNPTNVIRLVAGFGSGALAAFIVLPIASLPSWAKILIIIGACLLGFLLISGNEDLILCIGTAFIGAVLICHGIGEYAGGFPSLMFFKNKKQIEITKAFIAYIAGIVLITLIGARLQWNSVVGGAYKERRVVYMSSRTTRLH